MQVTRWPTSLTPSEMETLPNAVVVVRMRLTLWIEPEVLLVVTRVEPELLPDLLALWVKTALLLAVL